MNEVIEDETRTIREGIFILTNKTDTTRYYIPRSICKSIFILNVCFDIPFDLDVVRLIPDTDTRIVPPVNITIDRITRWRHYLETGVRDKLFESIAEHAFNALKPQQCRQTGICIDRMPLGVLLRMPRNQSNFKFYSDGIAVPGMVTHLMSMNSDPLRDDIPTILFENWDSVNKRAVCVSKKRHKNAFATWMMPLFLCDNFPSIVASNINYGFTSVTPAGLRLMNPIPSTIVFDYMPSKIDLNVAYVLGIKNIIITT